MIRRWLLKRIMTASRWAVEPEISPHLKETFNHARYIDGSAEERREFRRVSSEARYHEALANPVDSQFGIDLDPLLRGGYLLDLGCFTGGKAVAYCERYRLGAVAGIDVDEPHIEAAREFAEEKGIDGTFLLTGGEDIQFPDETFDAIISTDVFEHVRSVEKVLDECHRVLKTGGVLCVIFPSYWGQAEHHLSMVTTAPFIQLLASGAQMVDVYNEIIDERGDEKTYWYRRANRELEPWESGHTINGTSRRQFCKLIHRGGWKVELDRRTPPLARRNPADGRAKKIARATLWPVLNVLAHTPVLDEVCAHRITFILRKR